MSKDCFKVVVFSFYLLSDVVFCNVLTPGAFRSYEITSGKNTKINKIDELGDCRYNNISAKVDVVSKIAKSALIWNGYSRVYTGGPFINVMLGDINMGQPLMTKEVWNDRILNLDEDCLAVNLKNQLNVVDCSEGTKDIVNVHWNNKCFKAVLPNNKPIRSLFLPLDKEEQNKTNNRGIVLYFDNESQITAKNIKNEILKYEEFIYYKRNIGDALTFCKKTINKLLIGNKKKYVYCFYKLEPLRMDIFVDAANNDLKLNTSLKVTTNHILCFTNGEEYYVTRVPLVRLNDHQFQIIAQNDGEYRCRLNNTLYERVMSEQLAYRKKNNQNWALMLQFFDVFVISDEMDIKDQYMLRFFDTMIGRIVDGIKDSKVTLKRIYYNGQALYHVQFPMGFDEGLIDASKYKEVVFMRKLGYCFTSDLIMEAKVNYGVQIGGNVCIKESSESSAKVFECVGDIFSGAQWARKYGSSCGYTIIGKFNHNANLAKGLEMTLVKKRISEEDLRGFVDDVAKIFSASQNIEKSSLPQMLNIASKIVHFDNSSREIFVKKTNISMAITNNLKNIVKVEKIDSEYMRNIVFMKEDELQNFVDDDKTDILVDLSHIDSAKRSRLAITVINNCRYFPIADRSKIFPPLCNVIDVAISNEKLSPREYIDIHFKMQPGVNYSDVRRFCSFWTYSDWSTAGCELISGTSEAFETCRCNHLTHFTELLSSGIYSERLDNSNKDALTTITYIGCGSSLVGLAGIGSTAMFFKKWREQFHNKIRLNLSLAISLLLISFLSQAKDAPGNENRLLCIGYGVVLHYSVLSTFLWMLIVAIHAYTQLVTVFSKIVPHKLMKACFIGWIVPMLPVILLFVIDSSSYTEGIDDELTNRTICYPSKIGFWLALFLPVFAIIVINTVLLGIITYSVFCSNTESNGGRRYKFCQIMSVNLLLFFMFGLPWIFGMFSDLVSNYLFCILATSQGFAVSLFFILGNKDTRELWWSLIKEKISDELKIAEKNTEN